MRFLPLVTRARKAGLGAGNRGKKLARRSQKLTWIMVWRRLYGALSCGMTFMITKKWNGFTERRSPVTAGDALDAIAWAQGQASVIVEITNEHGVVVSKTQLRRALRA
jgi:hypothetical protein